MRMRDPKEGSYEPIAPLDLPHSLHAFQRVSPTDERNEVLSFSVLFINEYEKMIKIWAGSFIFLIYIITYVSL